MMADTDCILQLKSFNLAPRWNAAGLKKNYSNNMTLRLLILILLPIVGCSIGSQGVYYEEMDVKPTISIDGNILTVKVSQPIRHSALVLYRIDLSVDHSRKEVFISAEQGIGREFLSTLVVNLKDYEISEATSYMFYWIDPPIKKTTKLDVLKIVN